jgi:hypothetical protein
VPVQPQLVALREASCIRGGAKSSEYGRLLKQTAQIPKLVIGVILSLHVIEGFRLCDQAEAE